MRTALKVMACLVLVLIGTGLLVWRKEKDKLFRPPVDLPLPMSAHEVDTGIFAAPEDSDYLIAITADRTIPPNTLDCLLGIDALFDEKCEGTPTVVNAVWAISTNGQELAHGSSSAEREAFSSDRVGRGIGHFAAKRGHLYRLDVRFLSDISPLNSARPHIEVFGLPPVNYDEYGNSLKYALARPTGCFLVLVGTFLAAFVVLKSVRKTHIRGS
jgi:hypothetical protein